jgi:hypothetical protein
MLLRLAGVSIADIAADYGLSGENVRPLMDSWVAEASSPEERALRRRIGASPPEVMTDVLESLERRHGTTRAYLVDVGAAPDALDRARARLLR